ncbi:MAG: D-alanine--D-alanine ligase [Clostridiales bacterium]|jgi:D-alanine-D-alanine ligase|nr:D-alanine--D-alanine ligase [Clostridiales bacterium]
MNIAVIYGGKSCEHNISVITGVQVLNAVKGHNVVPIYIDNRGIWHTGKNLGDINNYKQRGRLKTRRVYLKPGDGYLYAERHKRLAAIDCAVLCNHGAGGEDGSLQGLLQLCGIPYTGSGVAASACGMDKALMKKLFKADRLPVVPYAAVTREAFDADIKAVFARLKKLGYPVIVKPASGGSSIGIGMAHDGKELLNALHVAFMWDNTVVAERALTDFVELNCAVLGDRETVITSEVEQPVGWSEFLSFADKYEKSKFKSENGGRLMPAAVPDETRAAVREAAERAFRSVGAAGVARVDFMLDRAADKLYVNEINTIPGSLAHYLFSFDGMDFSALLDRLIGLAVKEKERQDRLQFVYTSTYKLRGKE